MKKGVKIFFLLALLFALGLPSVYAGHKKHKDMPRAGEAGAGRNHDVPAEELELENSKTSKDYSKNGKHKKKKTEKNINKSKKK